ncbi:hypothetical protein O3G_MSEX000202 [Manduca sexta]|nr:hypothetical protein O3G_MSEX000202 [Manduca sexta]KAG6438764.1 hypothetical protein O3G_MSEX000202 [Manduca sexta]
MRLVLCPEDSIRVVCEECYCLRILFSNKIFGPTVIYAKPEEERHSMMMVAHLSQEKLEGGNYPLGHHEHTNCKDEQ